METISVNKELLRQALKFVEANHCGGPDAFELITALSEALDEPSDEPVAWVVEDQHGERLEWAGDVTSCSAMPTFPLYTRPQPASWVGLTRKEILEIEVEMKKYYDYQHQCKTVCLPEFARSIEAKLREKNCR